MPAAGGLPVLGDGPGDQPGHGGGVAERVDRTGGVADEAGDPAAVADQCGGAAGEGLHDGHRVRVVRAGQGDQVDRGEQVGDRRRIVTVCREDRLYAVFAGGRPDVVQGRPVADDQQVGPLLRVDQRHRPDQVGDPFVVDDPAGVRHAGPFAGDAEAAQHRGAVHRMRPEHRRVEARWNHRDRRLGAAGPLGDQAGDGRGDADQTGRVRTGVALLGVEPGARVTQELAAVRDHDVRDVHGPGDRGGDQEQVVDVDHVGPEPPAGLADRVAPRGRVELLLPSRELGVEQGAGPVPAERRERQAGPGDLFGPAGVEPVQLDGVPVLGGDRGEQRTGVPRDPAGLGDPAQVDAAAGGLRRGVGQVQQTHVSRSPRAGRRGCGRPPARRGRRCGRGTTWCCR